jgi:hypothetical protein
LPEQSLLLQAETVSSAAQADGEARDMGAGACPPCLDPTAIPGLRVLWAQGLGRGPSSRAPGVYRCTQAAQDLATETTLCERRYIKPRWRPISQPLRTACFARRSLAPWPRAQSPAVGGACLHTFWSDKSPAAGVVRNTSTHMAAVAQARPAAPRHALRLEVIATQQDAEH